jgi:hypothetical protein
LEGWRLGCVFFSPTGRDVRYAAEQQDDGGTRCTWIELRHRVTALMIPIMTPMSHVTLLGLPRLVPATAAFRFGFRGRTEHPCANDE